MSERITKAIVMKRFELAAKVMGWPARESVWVVPTTKGFCTSSGCLGHHGTELAAEVGAHRLDKHGRSDRYDLVRISTCGGGESTVRHPCSGVEMLAFLEGVIVGGSARQGGKP
jgi:hypothetical protein